MRGGLMMMRERVADTLIPVANGKRRTPPRSSHHAAGDIASQSRTRKRRGTRLPAAATQSLREQFKAVPLPKRGRSFTGAPAHPRYC
ncbi:hypothetical protein KCP77_15405 [Salmonella enterica subsp. enterica]|nr:hypothetical protein KCP77_15405 [Salmonella enterica subsp. enterica]